MDTVTAPIFDVQRFSIHDGPGIRTLVFFKGCNLRCAWCQNPESQQVAPVISFYASRCDDCLRCADACAQGAVNAEGYRIDHERCNLCLACVEACPEGALKPIGEQLTPDRLLERILADSAYYDSSGGGVTLSGGEPTLYPKFVDRLLDLCRERNVHAAIETCGTFSYDRWRAILRKLDLIYFDLKIMDEARHREATGRGNRTILANARSLVADGFPVEFRLALVPGYTDTPENLEAIADFLASLNQSRLHLLAYHNMGEAKIGIIYGPQKKLGLANYAPERLLQVAAWFERRGIAAFHEA